MSRGADLFVVCKNPDCRSEVSPYVTECPYCGTRLRKRAPKLDRLGRPARPRRRPAPSLGRLRTGEIPGIRGDSRPWATAAILLATGAVWIAWRGDLVSLADLPVDGPLHGDWWRVASSQFTYANGVYQFGALLSVAVFGWLLERRYGPVLVVMLFLLAGCGGTLLEVAVHANPVSYGADGAALGLLAAWAVPDLMARRADEHYEGDLLAAAAAAVALALVPLARAEVSWIAALAGGLIGLLMGALLQRLAPRP